MEYILFDLETTCWDDDPPTEIREIIEIGAVKLDQFGTFISKFESYVKPLHFPFLSPFCLQLTQISQIEINKAQGFSVVGSEFRKWIGEEDYCLCAWGAQDRRQLVRECLLHQLEYDWVQPYMDVKKQYHYIRKHSRYFGLKSSLIKEGFEFEGTHHRAYADTLNMMKIFIKYIDLWNL